MINFIVVGKDVDVVVAVLQSIRSFTDAGCMVVGTDETRALRWSGLCRGHALVRFDGRDDEYFSGLVEHLGRQTPHLVLIPCDSEGMRMTNRVRERLAIDIIPIPDTATLDGLEDRLSFVRSCNVAALAVPDTRSVDPRDPPTFDNLARHLRLPFILRSASPRKPFGTRLVETRAEYARALESNEALGGRMLVAQRHIEGEDIAVNLLADRGQLSAFAIEQARGSHISFVANDELERMAGKLCHAGAYHGPLRLRARIERESGKLFLLDAETRFWKSLPASIWCGLNFVAESMRKTPRRSGLPRLVDGIAALGARSHPLLRPAMWPQLLLDAGERGRLLRAMTLDFYGLSRFVTGLPSLIVDGLRLRAAARVANFQAMLAQRTAALKDARGHSGRTITG